MKRLFWTYVDESGGPLACWPWRGCKDACGYGRVWLWDPNTGTRVNTGAHRVAWMFTHGEIPAGFCVCHSCDNPSCVNPAHLWLGTQGDNVRDMHEKGRAGVVTHPERLPRGDAHFTRRHPELRVRGERQGSSKLTQAVVREMRQLYGGGGWTQRQLADRYGVTRRQVGKVVTGKQWQHVLTDRVDREL